MDGIKFFEILIIVFGAGLAFWGLFQQLIVGGAVTMYSHCDEMGLRLVILQWVSHGAFQSFMGLQSAVLVMFYSIRSGETVFVLTLTSIALLVLIIHTLVTGVKKLPRPLRIGFAFQTAFFISCIAGLIAGRFVTG